MALPTGGELGMNQINVELRRTGTAQISLDSAENGSYGAINTNSRSYPSSANPAAISEWYGYNHSAVGGVETFALPEIGFDVSNRDTACRNAAIGRTVQVWGDGPALQDCNNLYRNATGTAFAGVGWYAENFTQFERYWTGTRFSSKASCRI